MNYMMLRLVFCFIFLFGLVPLKAESLKLEVKAKSAILYNPQNGAILFKKKEKEPQFPASIMKIATALFVVDGMKADLEKECIPSKNALQTIKADLKHANPAKYPAHILEHDGTMMGIRAGKTYRIRDLLHGMLFVSGNDASNAVAEHLAPSIEEFMKKFNGYLKQKGIVQTEFHNPHGLYYPGQVTTAYEMALITEWAFEHPVLSKILGSRKYELEENRMMYNLNPLLKEGGKYYYAKSLGGKTGYTASSGKNLVAVAEDNGRRLIAVLLGYENRADRYTDAIALFEAAFREKKQGRILFAKEHECFSRKIESTKKTLNGILKNDVVYNYFSSEEQALQAKLVWLNLPLPIEIGNVVGKLVIENSSGKVLIEEPIYAQNKVSKPFKFLWLIPLIGLIFVVFGIKKFKKMGKFSN